MKPTILANIFLVATSFLSHQACYANNYTISGNVAGNEGRLLLLKPTSAETADTIADYTMADDAFSFTGNVSAPTEMRLEVVGTNFNIPLFVEPGAEIVVDADVDDDRLTTSGGGRLQQISNDWRARKAAMSAGMDSIADYYRANYDLSDYYWVIQAKGAMQRYGEKCDSIENAFLAANDNIVAASYLFNKRRELISNKTLARKYDLLGENARNSLPGSLLADDVKRIASITLGGTPPDFTMETPDGKSISLHGVKGKVKILDFWASWCGPCRAENPNVKRIYEKFHKKGLEILSVSLDTDKGAWVNAIQTDGLPWHHASELGKANTARDVYNVYAIPFILILDENNKIIAEGLRGERLEEFLSAQFAE